MAKSPATFRVIKLLADAGLTLDDARAAINDPTIAERLMRDKELKAIFSPIKWSTPKKMARLQGKKEWTAKLLRLNLRIVHEENMRVDFIGYIDGKEVCRAGGKGGQKIAEIWTEFIARQRLIEEMEKR